MSDTSKLLKNSVIYLLGNVLSKMLIFLMLPLYTKYIVPADYGYYDLANTYINLISTVVCFEIWSTIMRYMLDKKYRENKAKPITNGLIIYFSSTAVIIIAFIVINHFINFQYAPWILLYGIALCMCSLYGYISRGYGQNVLFAVSGISATVVNAGLNIILIVGFSVDYKSLYIAYIASVIVQCIILESRVKLLKNVRPGLVDKKLLIDMLKFTVPLCLNTGAFWFLSSYGKTVVAANLSIADNGYYSIAAKFGMIIQLVSACFIASWQELAFTKGMTSDKDDYYEYMVGLFIKFLFIASVIILSCIYIVFPIMIDAQYAQAINIVPFFLIATMLSAFSSFLTAIFGAIKKTNVLFTSTLVGCIVNIVLVHLLINVLGIHAVTVSMMVGFLACVIIRIYILKKNILLRLDAKRIGFVYMPLLIVGTIVYFSNNLMYTAIFLVITLIVSSFLCKEELQALSQAIRKKIKK